MVRYSKVTRNVIECVFSNLNNFWGARRENTSIHSIGDSLHRVFYILVMTLMLYVLFWVCNVHTFLNEISKSTKDGINSIIATSSRVVYYICPKIYPTPVFNVFIGYDSSWGDFDYINCCTRTLYV
jgi:flagellar biosynthesis protein FlhB